MTRTNDKIRALVLAALMVLSVSAGTVAFTGTAVAANDVDPDDPDTFPRDGLNTVEQDSLPAVVYAGETVNIEGVNFDAKRSGTLGDEDSITLIGIAGDAEGDIQSGVDPSDADFDGFEPGLYSANGDQGDGEQAEIAVREPEIESVELNTQANTDGADVTDGRITTEDAVAFLNVEYNFDEADKLSITVEDDDLEVTDQVVENNNTQAGDGFITESGTDERLDFSDVDAGQYTITVEGDDFGPSQTVTVNVSDEDVSVSLDETEVTKGERVVATIDGTPGTLAHIRIDSGDLDEDELEAELGEDSDYFDDNPVDTDRVAQEVFSQTGDVEVRGGSEGTDDSGENVVFAVGDLGDDGSVPIQINSQFIETGTITVEAAEGDDFTADADDSVDLTVEERAITVDSAPSNVAIGEEFTVNGTADEADEVRAYARIDQSWVPLLDENGNLAADENVDDDGTFEIDIDSGREINLPDNYRIGFVADPAYPDNVNPDEEIGQDTWGDFDTTESITVTTQEGSLSAELSSSTVASQTGDEITLSGSAIGQEQVDVYAIGPRGEIELRERINADEDNAFEEDYSFFDRRGSYTFIVVGEGRDGNFGEDVSDEPLDPEGGLTQEQAVEIIREAYEDAGSDNPIVELTLLSENPSLTLDVEDGAEVPQDDVTLSGTSNREDGTVVFIEVLDENDDAVFSTEAEVNGSTSSWSVEADMSDVETGDYTLRAEDDETSATAQISVVEEVSEETETPEPTDTPTPTPEPTDTPTPEPEETDTPTPEPTEETTTTTPGFGAVVAVLALLGAALLALRRD